MVLYYSSQPAFKSDACVTGIRKTPGLGKYSEVRLIMRDIVAHLDSGDIRTGRPFSSKSPIFYTCITRKS